MSLLQLLVILYVLITQYESSVLTQDKCSTLCTCKRKESSSKVEVAMCTVSSEETVLKCSVEWPVLLLTLKTYLSESTLLLRCKRIKRLMITAASTLTVLRSDMFQHSRSLETLVIKAPIQTLESSLLRHLTSLSHFEISETNIETISRSIFEECPISDRLRLVSNKITFIEDASFKNCIYLLKLDLSRNKLEKINSATFQGIFNLEQLDLSKNRIESIEDVSFKSLKKLRFLYIYENSLLSVQQDTFDYLESLTHLRLDSNKITHIAVEAFKSLRNVQSINLRNNKLSSLDIILFVNLKKLKLSFPDIDCVQIREDDYVLVSTEIQREFDKQPPCPGFKKIVINQGNGASDNQKLIQRDTVSTVKPNKKDTILVVIETHPYLIPMILGGLAVAIISVIVLSVVCHIKNQRINALRLQEIQLPMMQSTL